MVVISLQLSSPVFQHLPLTLIPPNHPPRQFHRGPHQTTVIRKKKISQTGSSHVALLGVLPATNGISMFSKTSHQEIQLSLVYRQTRKTFTMTMTYVMIVCIRTSNVNLQTRAMMTLSCLMSNVRTRFQR